MRRMASGISQRDHAAERGAKDDRIGDPQGVAERPHVVTSLRQTPAFSRPVLAAAIAAVVEIDDLGNIGQGRLSRPVDRVIRTRTAVKHQQGWFFPHDGTVGDEFCALDVEEQTKPVHGHMHRQAS
jgi:hypothetical protein